MAAQPKSGAFAGLVIPYKPSDAPIAIGCLTEHQYVQQEVGRYTANLKKHYLPEFPHLLKVPTDHPYPRSFPEEYNKPEYMHFSPEEIMPLQYMTMISNPIRGIGRTQGGWQDERGEYCELSSSSNSTPSNPPREEKKRAKISWADYQNFKKNGVKPPSRPATAEPTPDAKAAKDLTGNTSAGSAGIAMERVVSAAGSEVKVTVASTEVKKATAEVKSTSSKVDSSKITSSKVKSNIPEVPPPHPKENNKSRPSPPSSVTKDQARSVTNGHTNGAVQHSRPTLQTKAPVREHVKEQTRNYTKEHVKEPTRDQMREKNVRYDSIKNTRPPINHPLPPRPQSPPRREAHRNTPPKRSFDAFGIKQGPSKRPSTFNDTPPEKRQKVDGHVRTPSNPILQNPMRKLDTSVQSKGQPVKSKVTSAPQKSTPQTSRPSSSHNQSSNIQKDASKPSAKPHMKSTKAETSSNAQSQPPLLKRLSPLPDKLSAALTSESTKTSSATDKPRPAVATKNLLGIVGRLPPMLKSLPPNLSHFVDKYKELKPKNTDKEGNKKTEIKDTQASRQVPTATPTRYSDYTVEARHEKARQPDARGVARKTVKPKAGQAVKKTVVESINSNGQDEDSRDSLVIPIKYKKRQANDVVRILKTKARPDSTFLSLEAQRREDEKKEQARKTGSTSLKPSAMAKDDESSSDEGPLVKAKISSSGKKRPSDSITSEPAPKRTKLPEKNESTKASTPAPSSYKSPAVSSSSQKNLLSTPGRSESIKGTAMRRVDSSDRHAITPQAPSSVEKPRGNGSNMDSRPSLSSADIEKLTADAAKFADLAIKLKRKMDAILLTKSTPEAREKVSEKDRKMGLATGLECIVAYINARYTAAHLNTATNRPVSPVLWLEIIPLWLYIESETSSFPIFHALTATLGAICREQLDKVYMDALRENLRSERFVDEMRENSRLRSIAWEKAGRSRHLLKEFGGDEVLGPWSEIKQVTAYSIGVLTAFSRKQQVGWKRDPGFSN